MALFDVKKIDRDFYTGKLEEFLPDRLFDAHTHVFLRSADSQADTRAVSWPSKVADSNSIEDLEETARLLFPGKGYVPLLFGSPTDCPDITASNAYVSACAAARGYPALMLARPELPPDELEAAVLSGGFSGIKVYLTFAPGNIPSDEIRIFDFLPHAHLEVCNRRGWAVMLHIARPLRLRDPFNVSDLTEIDRSYPNVRLIVAHVGRAYCRADLGEALDILKGTRNMVFDISANTNEWVFEQLAKAVGSTRILYGSDLPVTRMRMRRIEQDGRYINLVPRGLYGDVSGDPNMAELDPLQSDALSYFLYEEIEAFRRASLKAGFGRSDIERIFWSNAVGLFG